MKWGLVAASASDMSRPVENLSVPQCLALALTGCVWTRWSFVINPVNYNLALVNVFVAGTNIYQLSRIFRARSGQSSAAADDSALVPTKLSPTDA
jgi:mitochondrial pyruvate carrier 2